MKKLIILLLLIIPTGCAHQSGTATTAQAPAIYPDAIIPSGIGAGSGTAANI